MNEAQIDVGIMETHGTIDEWVTTTPGATLDVDAAVDSLIRQVLEATGSVIEADQGAIDTF